MSESEKIMQPVLENHGIVTTEIVTLAGLARCVLKYSDGYSISVKGSIGDGDAHTGCRVELTAQSHPKRAYCKRTVILL